jgi:hypothetical protein
MSAPWTTDYELRAVVSAYLSGALDDDGLDLLDETLAEYGLTRKDIPKRHDSGACALPWYR